MLYRRTQSFYIISPMRPSSILFYVVTLIFFKYTRVYVECCERKTSIKNKEEKCDHGCLLLQIKGFYFHRGP